MMLATNNHSRECRINGSAEAFACHVKMGRFAREIGFDERRAIEVEIATSELATNILRHGVRGTITASLVAEPDNGLLLVAQDEGPGFDDIEHARRDGVSRGRMLASGIPHHARGGLGSGLGALERLTDSVDIANLPDGGSRVAVFKALRRGW